MLCIYLPTGCGISSSLTSLVISPSSSNVGVGKTQQFAATYYDENGKLVAVNPSWSVSGSFGTITSSGVFTGVTDGSGTVIASYLDKTSTANVNVSSNGSISGTLKTGFVNPVENIKVYLAEIPSYYGVTNSSGLYSIQAVPPGTYNITFDNTTNYIGTHESIALAVAETKQIDFLSVTPRLSVSGEIIQSNIDNIIVSGIITNNGTFDCESVTIKYNFSWTDSDGPHNGYGQKITVPSTITPESFALYSGLSPTPAVPPSSGYSNTRTITYTKSK